MRNTNWGEGWLALDDWHLPKDPTTVQRVVTGLISVTATTLLGGCGNGPLGPIPGGALSGTEAAYEPTALAAQPGVIVLETNPAAPYSVKVNSVNVDGNLYIDPNAERTWYQNIAADPNVRFRFDGTATIYPARAVRETNQSIVEQFETDRIVLRLDPR